MTKTLFSKTMLRILGAICLLLSSMCLYSDLANGILIGIAGFVVGFILLLVSAVIGMKQDVLVSSTKRVGRVVLVIACSIALHIAGIWCMTHVHWIVGAACILLGFANLLFLTPAAKGFVQE